MTWCPTTFASLQHISDFQGHLLALDVAEGSGAPLHRIFAEVLHDYKPVNYRICNPTGAHICLHLASCKIKSLTLGGCDISAFSWLPDHNLPSRLIRPSRVTCDVWPIKSQRHKVGDIHVLPMSCENAWHFLSEQRLHINASKILLQ